jgi:GMP synthase (glutamine-hydrolysing)
MVLGLQFHIEAAPGEIERWLIGHACEIAATRGVTVTAIRDDTAVYGPPLVPCAARLFADWLDGAGL